MLALALGLVFDEETRRSLRAAYLIGSAAAGIQPGSGHRRRMQGRLMRPRGVYLRGGRRSVKEGFV